MNKLLCSLGAKICAVILFIISCTSLAASGLAAGYLASANAYADEGKRLKYGVLEGVAWDMLNEAENEYRSYVESDEYKPGQAAVCSNILFNRENSNLAFSVTDQAGNILFYNYAAEASDVTVSKDTKIYRYATEKESFFFETEEERSEKAGLLENEYYDDPNMGVTYYMTDSDNDGIEEYALDFSHTSEKSFNITISGSLCSDLTARDEAYYSVYLINKLIQARYFLIAAAAVCFVVCIILFIFLICSAGHKRGKDGINLNWADRIPLDLYAAALFLIVYISFAAGTEIYSAVPALVAFAICIALSSALGLALIMSFAARAKAGPWWRNIVIFKFCSMVKHAILAVSRSLRRIFAALPHVWKAVLFFGCIVFAEFISIWLPAEADLVLWLFLVFTITPLVILTAEAYKQLLKGTEEISRGDLESQIDISRMFGDYRRMGKNLNNIRNGMSKAIDERMKSERFKTELITNVSHDIKTPLTSIINYVDLMKREEPENENMRQYLEVLDRQSSRLKNLIENLIEASKASTGNVSVNAEPCELCALISQTAGEFKDRLSSLGIELVTETPDSEVTIMADGRHLWRVFDNLMNNICKYAQPSTRAYISLCQNNDRAVIIFRNISRQRLTISAEELTERFVRGDSSRTTEGNGLGLFIAKSLTELQKGGFELSTDGDLFKITITFDIAKTEEEKEKNHASDSKPD